MSNRIVEIKALINEWNTNNNAAVYRDDLRRLLNWQRENLETLGDLIEKEFYTILAPYKPPHSTIVKRGRELIKDAVEGRRAYCDACEYILQSDWNFYDPLIQKKTPFEVKDFLTQCTIEIAMFPKMRESRQNFLQMIFDAWNRWASELDKAA